MTRRDFFIVAFFRGMLNVSATRRSAPRNIAERNRALMKNRICDHLLARPVGHVAFNPCSLSRRHRPGPLRFTSARLETPCHFRLPRFPSPWATLSSGCGRVIFHSVTSGIPSAPSGAFDSDIKIFLLLFRTRFWRREIFRTYCIEHEMMTGRSTFLATLHGFVGAAEGQHALRRCRTGN